MNHFLTSNPLGLYAFQILDNLSIPESLHLYRQSYTHHSHLLDLEKDTTSIPPKELLALRRQS